MTPLSRYRVPKIAQHAAFGHMNDYDLETQSLVGTDQVVGARDSVPACARSAPRHIRDPSRAPRNDAPSVDPLTISGVAKAWRDGRECWCDPVALSYKWLLRNRITTLLDPCPTNKSRRASLFGEGSPYLPYHRAPPAVIGD